MRSDRERDAEMDRLIRAGLTGEVAGPAEACPTADGLAAYMERTLTAEERKAMETHLAGCGRCQEALALLAGIPEAPAAPSPAASWWRLGWKRWLVPVAAAASAVFLYVALQPDAVLRQAASSRDEVAASVPAEPPEHAPAAPSPVLAPVGADKPSSRGERAASAPSRRPEVPVPPFEGQVKKGAPRHEVRVPQLTPEAVIPPAMPGQDTTTPLVGNRAAVPPLPAAPTAEPRQLADRAPAAVGGTLAGLEMRKQAPEVTGRTGVKPIATGAPFTAETRAPESSLSDVIVRPLEDARVRWRLLGPRILRSDDGGVSWQPQHWASAPLLAASAPSAATCWAVGTAGLVVRTTNGREWEARPFPERVDLVAVTAADALHATITARDGRRFSTEDGGRTWTLVE